MASLVENDELIMPLNFIESIRVVTFCCVFAHLISCASDDVKNEVQTKQPMADSTYTEKYRPQYHFTPESMWMNDPNGLVFYEGEYHLFYQYHPDSTVWGPMHWGHAVSTDLMHWQHLPIALAPDELGYIYSGSAVIDWKNTSGFGIGGEPPMVAIFTHHDFMGREAGAETYETQSIAYSNDRGRTWKKYAGNPVVKNPGLKNFRDPKVLWHEESAHWVMVVAAGDRVHIYRSKDLKSWEFASEFGANAGNHDGTWECPDLFPMAVKGKQKWVLIQNINPGHPNGGSGGQYFVGDFDGFKFSNDNPASTTLWIDYGKDNYAGVTFSDVPDRDGRRLFIGWMSNWQYAQKVPTDRWRSAMTLPRELKLIETNVGLRLSSQPVSTITSIRQEAVALGRGDLSGKYELLRNIKKKNGLYEVQLEFQKPDSGRVQIECYNSVGDLLYVGYDVDQNEYYIDRISAGRSDFDERFIGRHIAPCYYDSKTVKMRLFFDVSSVELFADDGRTVMTEIFFPDPPYTDMNVSSDQQPLKMKKGRVFELNSIWN